MNKELKSNLMPNWNFGPHKKNCKNVYSIVQLLLLRMGMIKTVKIVIIKNKQFHESKLLSLNIEKAKKELLWEPKLSLNETIKFTIDWYKNYFLKIKFEDISNYQIDYYTDKFSLYEKM